MIPFGLKHSISYLLKILLPFFLCGGILYWMYRDFDFSRIEHVLWHEMNWTWMLLSFPFGILAQTFRGWRWRQTLEPVDEHPRLSTLVNSVFLSYALSLVIPRVGEFARCAVLKRKENVSFAKALGTVVTERAIDSLLVLLIAAGVFLWQIPIFTSFFSRTGTTLDSFLTRFSLTGYLVTAICAAAVAVMLYFLLRRLAIYDKVRATITGIWQGISSLKNVKNKPLFIFFTLAIWLSYFLHYYLTFFCFEATSSLGLSAALVTFIVGSIAVIVPTPNGAGPWHFAVKTMLILYGIADTDALYFVLIVHTVQTLLVVALGVLASVSLSWNFRHSTK